MRIYRPYFLLKNWQYRYGLEHSKESEAWAWIGELFSMPEDEQPEWLQHPCFIENYGVDCLEKVTP